MARQSTRNSREYEIGGRVASNALGSKQPLEESPQRIEACHLGIGGERQAIGLAVVEKIALVVLEYSPIDPVKAVDLA
jgi:hypothetical protein